MPPTASVTHRCAGTDAGGCRLSRASRHLSGEHLRQAEVNPPGTAALPVGVVTTTGWLPTVPAGVVPNTTVPVGSTTTLVAGAPPTVTVAPLRLLPAMTNTVPPAAGPVAGVMVRATGAGDV